MATERQTRANARNAGKSTGPKSAAGKDRVSQNARKHGLTTPPPFEDVLAYYRIILEDQQADPGAADTDLHRAALTLAECEAACDHALDAETEALNELAVYLRTKGERDPLRLIEASPGLDLENPAVLELMLQRDFDDEDEDGDEQKEAPEPDAEEEEEADQNDFMRGGLRILYNINRHNLARRRRRLERIAVYRQRAEGRRRRAFKAWLGLKHENDNSKPNTRIG